MLSALMSVAYAANEAAATPYVRAHGAMDMMLQAGPMVKLVLLLLLVLSVACWAVIYIKVRLLRRAKKESVQFMGLYFHRKGLATLYRDSKSLEDSHLAEIFQIGYEELSRMNKVIDRVGSDDIGSHPETILENVECAMRGAILAETERLERFVPLLATTGNTAPFIGLFGTVWGIMSSFQEIGLKGAANLAVVAPGISEALIATAIGLATAIPAVVAYNHFANKIRAIENEMNNFATDFLNILRRDLLRRQVPKPEGLPIARGAAQNM